MIEKKKGAMFGLDARIALAIFGALSVITGAALYSAIREAKAVALLTDLQELSKSWEAYYLDTGINLPPLSALKTNPMFNVLDCSQLIENGSSVAGWNGPYIGYEVFMGNGLTYLDKGSVSITVSKDETWVEASWNDEFCSSGKKCSVWIALNLDNGTGGGAELIDNKIDNGDGDSSGNFRWYNLAGNTQFLFFRAAPIKNPHD